MTSWLQAIDTKYNFATKTTLALGILSITWLFSGLGSISSLQRVHAETYRWQAKYTQAMPPSQGVVLSAECPRGCHVPYTPQYQAPQYTAPVYQDVSADAYYMTPAPMPCGTTVPTYGVMAPCATPQTYVHTEVLPVSPRPNVIIREYERPVEVVKVVEVPKTVVKTVVKKVYVTRYVSAPRKKVAYRKPMKRRYVSAVRPHAVVARKPMPHVVPAPVAPPVLTAPTCQSPRVEAPMCVECMPVHCYH